MGGTLQLASTGEQGSVFRLELARIDDPARWSETPARSGDALLG